MKTLHVTTPEVSFDVDVPAEQAITRALALSVETHGSVTISF